MLVEEAKYGTFKQARICKRDPNFSMKWWEIAIPIWNIHKATQCLKKCDWFCDVGKLTFEPCTVATAKLHPAKLRRPPKLRRFYELVSRRNLGVGQQYQKTRLACCISI